MTIITNNQYRPLLYQYQIPTNILNNFDYLNEDDDGYYFKYKKNYYHLQDFIRTPNNTELQHYDGYHNDSFFSGIAIKLNDNNEVLVATFYA